MLKFMNPISGAKMLELKKEIAELKVKIKKKTNNTAEVKKLKRKLADKQTHYNILAERARGKV